MTSRRILVVDDEPALLDAICDYLTISGWQCSCASRGAEAMALVQSGDFDAVLTDITLTADADTDGLDIAAFIRERNIPVRVVVMTAHEEHAAAAAKLADRYLLKPMSLAMLARELESVLVSSI